MALTFMIEGGPLGSLGYHAYAGEMEMPSQRSRLSSHILFAEDEEIHGREHLLCPLPSPRMHPSSLIPSPKPPLGGEAEQGGGEKPHHLLPQFLGHGPQMDEGDISPFQRHGIYPYGRSAMV